MFLPITPCFISHPTFLIEITQTSVLPFGPHGLDNQPIFSVNSGVAPEDAWTKLSHLLTCAHASASEMCDVRVVDPGLLGATVHCIVGAKAWVDALLIRG